MFAELAKLKLAAISAGTLTSLYPYNIPVQMVRHEMALLFLSGDLQHQHWQPFLGHAETIA
jgi:hypothetical protein